MPRAAFYLIDKPRFREQPLLLVCELARRGYAANLPILVLAMAIRYLPLAVSPTAGTMMLVGGGLVEAARSLGDSGWACQAGRRRGSLVVVATPERRAR